jgi:hypothetical protein
VALIVGLALAAAATPATCDVDPALEVVLFHEPGGDTIGLQISVVNRGRDPWASTRGQQVVTHVVHDRFYRRELANPTGPTRILRLSRRYHQGQVSVPDGPPGYLLENYVAGRYPFAETMETSGFVHVELGFAPGIREDGNPCNDDADLSNNVVHLPGLVVAAFFESGERRRTFPGPSMSPGDGDASKP